ncbi:hypothetical protein, partial [Enterobacter cloacae complex sp. 4DZ3-17B2]|uniref:hypothetical protein n=1 Tax=Enterobacter cloacae complex sp. 4DZ3-17B2 TaxID=2511990 RepID=UPI001CA55CC7
MLEESPQYYMEDYWGQVKPVYRVAALAARGQNINYTAKRPPLQCYECGGPHCVAECPIRLQKNATLMQTNQVSMSTMPILMCNRCGIDHLIAQCPNNPNAPKITPLNLIEVIEEPSQSTHVVPVNVVTRSMLQTKNYILEERDTTAIAQSQKKKKTR